MDIKILHLINIQNTDKEIDGFGDQLLANIISSLDYAKILEVIMNKVGGK